MAQGLGAFAHLVKKDEYAFTYSYGTYNLNLEDHRNVKQIEDGTIKIDRECCLGSAYVDYGQALEKGQIRIENCGNCWALAEDGKTEAIAIDFMLHIFKKYKAYGEMPDQIDYYI